MRAVDPEHPNDVLRDFEAKKIGELAHASRHYHGMIDANAWKLAKKITQQAAADLTGSERTLLETHYRDQIGDTQLQLVEGAANHVRRALYAIAIGYGWALYDVGDVALEPDGELRERVVEHLQACGLFASGERLDHLSGEKLSEAAELYGLPRQPRKSRRRAQ